jgi:hypothetical protein
MIALLSIISCMIERESPCLPMANVFILTNWFPKMKKRNQ